MSGGTSRKIEQRRHVRVFLASSDDVIPERARVARAVERANRIRGPSLGIELDLWRWEVNALPTASIEGPQAAIDPHLEQSDIVVVIIWSRLGPGTEHELWTSIERAARTGRPHVLIYLCDRDAHPTSTEELANRQKVIELRRKLDEKTIYRRFETADELEIAVVEDLSNAMVSFDLVAGYPSRTFLRAAVAVLGLSGFLFVLLPELGRDRSAPDDVRIDTDTRAALPSARTSVTSSSSLAPPAEPEVKRKAVRAPTKQLQKPIRPPTVQPIQDATPITPTTEGSVCESSEEVCAIARSAIPQSTAATDWRFAGEPMNEGDKLQFGHFLIEFKGDDCETSQLIFERGVRKTDLWRLLRDSMQRCVSKE